MGKTSLEAGVRGSGQPPSQKSILGPKAKNAKPKTSPSVSRYFAPTASEVHQILRQDPESHSTILDRFRRAGGNVDRWSASDITAMANAITAFEDVLEMLIQNDFRRVLRDRLRELRRKLEEGGRQ